MREICTSGSVRGEGGNILTYSALRRPGRCGSRHNADPPQPTMDAHGGLRRVKRRDRLKRPGRLNPPYEPGIRPTSRAMTSWEFDQNQIRVASA